MQVPYYTNSQPQNLDRLRTGTTCVNQQQIYTQLSGLVLHVPAMDPQVSLVRFKNKTSDSALDEVCIVTPICPVVLLLNMPVSH